MKNKSENEKDNEGVTRLLMMNCKLTKKKSKKDERDLNEGPLPTLLNPSLICQKPEI